MINVGNLAAKRNFTHVKDTIKGYYLAMTKGVAGNLYLIGSQEIYTMKECLETLIDLSPLKNKITYQVDPKRVRPTELNLFVGKFDKINKETGWQPEIPFRSMMEDVLSYWRDVVKSK